MPAPPSSAPHPKRSRRRPVGGAGALIAALLAIALLLSGCGSSQSGGTSADPAGVVPAGAALYLGAEVRPDGALKTDALTVAGKLTHQANPYTRLLGLLQTPGSPTLDYAHDVAPWLGQKGGLFLSSLNGASSLLPVVESTLLSSSAAGSTLSLASAGTQGALVLNTTDASTASSFLDSQAAHAGAHAASFHGISYQVTSAGLAFAFVHGFAVIGGEAAVDGVIETAGGGASLAQAPAYAKLLAQAPAGALGHLYVAAAPQTTGTSGGILQALTGGRAANISLVPSSTSLAIDIDSSESAATGTPGGLLTSASEGARSLEALPGSSWLAVGLAHLGSSLASDVTALSSAATALGLTSPNAQPSATLSLGGLLSGLLAPVKALAADPEAQQALAKWADGGGIFAGGAGLLELKGGVVIESRNPTLSREAVPQLAGALHKSGDVVEKVSIPGTEASEGVRVPGLPLTLEIAAGTDASGQAKLILGLGEASVTEALNPTSTLASASSRSAAESALGEGIKPSLMFTVPTLLSLLEAVGLSSEGGALAKLLPALHAVGAINGGGHALGGEVERYRLLLELQ